MKIPVDYLGDFIHKVLSTITPELISKYPEQLALLKTGGKVYWSRIRADMFNKWFRQKL